MTGAGLTWAQAWRIARRDLSARFKGLRLMIVCLFLGVGAIAAIGTLTGAIEGELAARGRTILGGDVEVAVWQRALTAPERAALARLGTVSEGTRLQAMASTDRAAAPVELKAVDAAWPMVGRLKLADGRAVGAPPAGTVWLGEGAAARHDIATGATIRIGGAPIRVGGIIADEPDRLSEGFTLGPVAIVDANFPRAAGLLQPGAMYRTKARVAFAQPSDADAAAKAIEAAFPSSGFTTRSRDRAAPGADRFVERLGEFLVLVGLAALVIAGIGIGGGVASWLEARRTSIATLKVLGATARDIERITLLQLGTAALAGSAAGIVAGVLVTPLLTSALSALLPVPEGFVFAPLALLRAGAFGLLVALGFSALPLARARAFPAMALMRARVSPVGDDWRRAAPRIAIAVAGVTALAMLGARQPLLSAGFLGGAAAMLALLALLGKGIAAGLARLPRPRNPLLRSAIANLHRPGAPTGALVTAIGFGLSAFVLLAGVQTSLDANISSRVPQRAPDYFVLDVPKLQGDAFRAAVIKAAPQAKVRLVPALRGAILAYGPAGAETRVADLKDRPEGAWALRGERGLTYSEGVPEGNSVTAGKWWPANYTGEPLVSVDEKLADAVGLKLGDTITIGLLGVERSATVASFRRIDWDSLGFNYVLVFSPNALSDAPHNLAAMVDLPAGAPKRDLLRVLTRAFPSSSVIETGPLLRDARDLLSQLSAAVLAAAGVAVLAGIAVLLGAIAAARATRTYDTVILRVLGASRRQLVVMQLAEYGLLAGLMGAVALVLGTTAAWGVITQVFEFDWLPNWAQVFGVLGAGLALVLAFALGASLPVLRARPARVLREL